MKDLENDWAAFINHLDEWERLSLRARQVFLTQVVSQPFALSSLGGVQDELQRAGFVHTLGDKRRGRLPERLRFFRRALRAMRRHQALAEWDVEGLAHYIRDNFSRNEETELAGHRYVGTEELARWVSSIDWVRDLLRGGPALAEDELLGERLAGRWEDPHDPGGPLQGVDALQREVVAILRQVVEFLISDGPSLGFADLRGCFEDVPLDRLGAAIDAGISKLFLFPSLDGQTLTPELGVWPAIADRCRRSVPALPAAVQPAETFHLAYLLEDMTQVVIAGSAEPQEVRRADLRFHARHRKAIQSGCSALPDWVATAVGMSWPDRIDRASILAWHLGFLEPVVYKSKDCLGANAAGRRWLARPVRDRLRVLLDAARGAMDLSEDPGAAKSPFRIRIRAAGGSTDDWDSSRPRRDRTGWLQSRQGTALASLSDWAWWGGAAPGRGVWRPIELLTSMEIDRFALHCAVFRHHRPGEHLPLAEFALYQARMSRPLSAAEDSLGEPIAGRAVYVWRHCTSEDMESVWETYVTEFVARILVPLGGASLGRLPDGRITFALEEPGLYLLGLAEEFDYGPAEEGRIVVQPNFDVVFLSAAPAIEAAIARFAERRGRGVGTLFQITRQSILGAARAGIAADDVLAALRHVSSNELPENVVAEIRGWFSRCRRVTRRAAVILSCPDAETANQVAALAGRKARRLDATTLELLDPSCQPWLERRLMAQGIFLGTTSARNEEGEPLADSVGSPAEWI